MSNSLDKEKKEVEKAPNKTIDEKQLEKLAAEELLREACQGAVRAEAVGPSGWLRNKNPKTNKTFLKNTLKNAISSNNFNFNKTKKDVKEGIKYTKPKSSQDERSVRYKPYKKR